MRPRDVGIGRHMENAVKATGAHEAFKPFGVEHVATDEFECRMAAQLGEVRFAAKRQVVGRHDTVIRRDQRVTQMAADESGAAGDQYLHERRLLTWAARYR